MWSLQSSSKKKRRPAKRGSECGSAMVIADRCVSCTTFNILAPIYKRIDKEDQSRRESQCRAYWLSRNQSIIDRLLVEKSSIICLQEVWLGNAELVEMYEKRLEDAGYRSVKLARTNNRGDELFLGTIGGRNSEISANFFDRERIFCDLEERIMAGRKVEVLEGEIGQLNTDFEEKISDFQN
ncbi:hypothetical protein M5K25_026420 [Dendrobium thyrsiflorum]|uniref:Endonuclease/exonuclease/phosphatase domain-containing protein n=1 Tax=Dendrobium thyrsiflorum TaxID=117978 RepID=A0ABD0TXN6_DENTH